MKIFQYSQFQSSEKCELKIPFTPDVIFLFVSPYYNQKDEFINDISKKYPDAIIAGNASFDDGGIDNPYVKNIEITAVQLEEYTSEVAIVSMDEVYTSYEAGDILSEKLNGDAIKHVFLFSDGYTVRGADLLNGFRYSMIQNISITGNITPPANSFQGFVIANGKMLKDHIVAVAMYSEMGSSKSNYIDRFERIGADVLNRDSLEKILTGMDVKPEPSYS